ncbi:MAG: hypothetical protein ACXWV4_01515 [Flavitalea sp.]
MKFSLVIFCALFAFACSENKKKEHPENSEVNQNASAIQGEKDTTASESYFPVLDFMKSEISAVDSLPVGIKVYRTVGEKTDSGYLQNAEFHQLSEEFLTPELVTDQFKRTYTESSFYDKSNKTSTFHYETKKQDAIIRRIDIITSATDTYDKVTSLYFEKVNRQDQDLKKLIWKPGQEFRLIEQNKVTRVVWQY